MDNAAIFDVAYIVASIILFLTCWRLWRFFRGGVFSKTWKILSATAIFLLSHSIACLADIIFMDRGIILLHDALQLIVVVLFTYGVWTFQQAWVKLSR